MFNRQINDDLAVAQEIVDIAVNRAHVPGQSTSRGNASGAYSSITSELLTEPVSSGTDENGVTTFPLLLDIDETNSTEARLA